jgi:hypothetical protein
MQAQPNNNASTAKQQRKHSQTTTHAQPNNNASTAKQRKHSQTMQAQPNNNASTAKQQCRTPSVPALRWLHIQIPTANQTSVIYHLLLTF